MATGGGVGYPGNMVTASVLVLALQSAPAGVPGAAWRCAAELNLSACDAAVKLELDPLWAARVRVFHSLVHDRGEDSDFDTAARLLDEAIALAPDYALAHYRRASFLEPEDSVESYRKVIALRPDWSSPYVELARVLARERRYEEELEVLRAGASRAPGNMILASALADNLMRTKQYEAAVPVLERLLDLEPRRVRHWESLGNALVQLGRLSEARDAFRRAGTLTDDPRSLSAIAANLARIEDDVGAATALERAVAFVEPNVLESIESGRWTEANFYRTLCVNLIHTLGRLDRPLDVGERREQCRAPFLSAVGSSPDSAAAWVELGDTERALEDLPSALEAYERARLSAPELPQPDLRRGRVLVALGRYDEALEILEHWMIEDPEDYASYARTRGSLLESLGRIEQALPVYRKLADAAADWNNPLNFVADGPVSHERLVEAYAVLEHRDGVSEARLGSALERVGDLEGALEAFRRAVRAEPEAAWPEIQLALFFERRGRLVEAGEAFARAENRDPEILDRLAGARFHRDLVAKRLANEGGRP